MIKKLVLPLLVCLFAVSFASCESEQSKALSQIKEAIPGINDECPMAIDDLTIWESVNLDDQNVVYNYSIKDAEALDLVDLVKENLDEYKQSISEGLSTDSNFRAFKELLVKAGLGIQYHYVGAESGKTLDIFFTPEEVAAI